MLPLVEHCATCLQYLIWASWTVSSSSTGSTLFKKKNSVLDGLRQGCGSENSCSASNTNSLGDKSHSWQLWTAFISVATGIKLTYRLRMWMAVLTHPETMSLSHAAFPALMSCVMNVKVAEAVKGGRERQMWARTSDEIHQGACILQNCWWFFYTHRIGKHDKQHILKNVLLPFEFKVSTKWLQMTDFLWEKKWYEDRYEK